MPTRIAFVGWNGTWKGNSKDTMRSDELIRSAHHRGNLGKNARDCMKNLYYGFKTVDQLSIPIAICLELLCFVLEETKDGIGGIAILEGLGRGMCDEVYASLFGIVRQGSIENGLKVGRGVRCRRHRQKGW